uniref:Pyruvate, phosphate dikinase n=1 Tax=Octactis speculum TaxID=3111310 RepID=A0A7S2HJX9_9STRA|mmetsp:Transcript_6862/g.8503  ORF Transcript_6862/g.8503 Transcript_6862/m.8503 type:complete len:942 (+) Transcript_6862:32-2857(+)|eukprot:CAMPEP_0185768426 /NCGR_PEP_ID=MMETSP1174-20130828/49579_1 /TAXON_ID=35687 /ORGANISM="Dictyocha speculum, Strain CCMP1381" /LENGTH=941 /DNA_ID=CAMNT_0028453101 /DNA_START=22 /DNA_END=2847 /DNA_ORIENTATION=+
MRFVTPLLLLSKEALGFNFPHSRVLPASAHLKHQVLPAVVSEAVSLAEPPQVLPTVVSEVVSLTEPPLHFFGDGKGTVSDVGGELKWLLGGKGANLAEMSALGLSTPPGFTITTEVCAQYESLGNKIEDGIWQQILESLQEVEISMGTKLGSSENPLLLSVRSGAAISMPGMMDTVLNLGLTDSTVEALALKTGNPRFAYDSYRRFLDMFGDVVMGIPHEAFEEELCSAKASAGVEEDNELSAEDLKSLIIQYKKVYETHGFAFPSDPLDQLRLAVCAVFDSWQSPRALKFMEVQGITGLIGTAVNIQAMAFGNMGDTSCTGVLFTRDPNTGDSSLFGEYLINAQGEDVVAGIRTPLDMDEMKVGDAPLYEEILRNCRLLETHFKDMQDIEFTVQEGKLFLLQTRSGKRSGKAAVKIATDLVKEGLVTKEQAVNLVTPENLDTMLHPQFEDEDADTYVDSILGQGLPASPGAATGIVAFTTEDVERLHKEGVKSILVRAETSPEDVGGMYAAAGILTARGGMTSHAAVVARGWGKTCVCGLGDLRIDEEGKTMTLGGVTLKEGDLLSLNGNTGEVLEGSQPMVPPKMSSGDLGVFMGWVDEIRSMKVLANADSPADAKQARLNGAEGIGLCRTEHMFFDHLNEVRKVILASNQDEKTAALADLLPLQRSDFAGIFEAMDGLPVTVRLLDPPLHEFLPHTADPETAAAVGLSEEALSEAIEQLRETNPMLGLRGCRLGITSPDIISMQARAVIEAALDEQEKGVVAIPQLMVPLIGTVAEYTNQAKIIHETASMVFKERGTSVNYKVGTMIEVPRAAMIAANIAEAGAEFFSYGTNDLTQMTYGYSRDDVGSFLPEYLRQGILPSDPFQVFDQEGVGHLVRTSTIEGRRVTPGLKCGVCGEHGGEPSSVMYFDSIDQDYVSCSPFRVPIARLSAAQAVAKRE